MKIFRHQPLLVWTLVLTVLLTVLAVGALAGGDATESRAVVPLAQTGASAAEELLRRLPGVHATIEAGTYPAWIEDYAAYARAEAAEHRAENPQAWNSVVAAASAAENVDPQARPALLGTVENLNSAVFALVRSYR